MSNIANAPRYAPGKASPFIQINPQTIVSKRAPLGQDHSEVSTLWVEGVDASNNQVNAVWINTGSNAGSTVWTNLVGGSASFQNILLPYSTNLVGRIEFGGIATIIVPEITSIYVGQAAGNVSNTGNHNVAVGELALSALTTGHDDTALGYEAGSNLTTGSSNVLVGSLAGTALTTGHDNVAIGGAALSASTTSLSNIAIGSGALSGVTTGTGQNIAIGGNGVLAGITTGATNIAIGYGAGSALVTGTESGNIYINDPGVNGESNEMRLTSNGGGVISTTGTTTTLELKTNGLVQVDAVLATVASPTAAWTANQRVTRARFTGFTTASAGTQTFTLTSNQIAVNGAVLVTVTNLDASGNHALMGISGIVQAANTLAIHTVNNGAGALGAGDDVNVTVWVID